MSLVQKNTTNGSVHLLMTYSSLTFQGQIRMAVSMKIKILLLYQELQIQVLKLTL